MRKGNSILGRIVKYVALPIAVGVSSLSCIELELSTNINVLPVYVNEVNSSMDLPDINLPDFREDGFKLR